MFLQSEPMIKTERGGNFGSVESCNFSVIQHSAELQQPFEPKIGVIACVMVVTQLVTV